MCRLCLEAAVYGSGQAADRAPLLRGRPRSDAPTGHERPDLDGTSSGNGRTPIRHDEMADGLSPVPGARIEKSKSGIGSRGHELQSETSNQHSGSAGAAPSVAATAQLRRSDLTICKELSCRLQLSDFSHSLHKGEGSTPSLPQLHAA